MTIHDMIRAAIASRGEHMQAALGSVDVTNQRDLTWDEAVLTYGDYSSHFAARLGSRPTTRITHYWRERTIRAAAANAQDEGFAYADLSHAAGVLPVRKTNTCQIFAGLVGITKSEAKEARSGHLGDELRDFLADQTAAEYRGILKDVDSYIINGVEATTDPRQMKGLAGAVGTWNGFIQTNRINAGGDKFAEGDVEDAFEAVWNATNGQYFPTAMYMPIEVARLFKDWTDKVQMVINISDPASMTVLKAGTAVGYYQHQAGVAALFVHPSIAYSETPGNNYVLGVHEPLCGVRLLRDMEITTPAAVSDNEEAVITTECTLECKVEKAHFLIRNWSKS